MNGELDDPWGGFSERRRCEQGKLYAREPKAAKDIIAAVMRRHGYGRVLSMERYHEVIRDTVGDMLASCLRVTGLHGGRLEILVANSTALQELAFYRKSILEALDAAFHQGTIADIRFRIGQVDTRADSR